MPVCIAGTGCTPTALLVCRYCTDKSQQAGAPGCQTPANLNSGLEQHAGMVPPQQGPLQRQLSHGPPQLADPFKVCSLATPCCASVAVTSRACTSITISALSVFRSSLLRLPRTRSTTYSRTAADGRSLLSVIDSLTEQCCGHACEGIIVLQALPLHCTRTLPYLHQLLCQLLCILLQCATHDCSCCIGTLQLHPAIQSQHDLLPATWRPPAVIIHPHGQHLCCKNEMQCSRRPRSRKRNRHEQ